MANTIRIGTFEVSSFKVGLKDPKIYLGDILLYPTGGYKVCYAVVEDITQYSDTEFEDVYDKATEKWFKLNNLNQYEKYGIYGSGRTSCEGSTSRLPQGYTEVEYIRQNSNYDAYINTGVILFDNTSNTYTVTTKLASEFHSNLGCATIISCERVNSPYDGLGYRYKCSSTVNQLEFFGGHPNYTSSVVDNGDGTRTVTFQSSGNSSFTTDVPLSYMAAFSSTTYGANASWRHSDTTIYSSTIVKNGITVRDFVPTKRDSDSVYGLYDLINDVFYTSPNGNNFIGGEPVTPTDCVTTYEGKLTIDDDYEYEWNGSSWVNLGEVSGSSRVPIGYTEVEYVENTSTAYIDTGFKPNQNTKILITTQCVTSTSGGRQIGAGGYDKTNAIQFDYESGAQGTLHISWGTTAGWTTYSSCVGDYNKHTYEWDGNVFYRDKGEQNQFSATTVYGTYQCTDNLGIFTRYQNGSGGGSSECFRGKVFDFKMYDNGTLIRDLVPAKRDSDDKYGMYDIVNDVFYVSPNNINFSGGEPITPTEYPKYYSEKSEPLDNLTFITMAEAQAYAEANCVYVGLKATINGDKYVFSGDSQSGYEWVYNPSRLPVGYTEVEYIQNTGTSYLNTNFVPNQDTRIVCDMQLVTASNFPRLWGAGAWNSATGIQPDYEGGYLRMSWLGKTSWTIYNSVPQSFDRKVYDVNKNYLYVDNIQIGSNTYTTRTASDPIGVFTYIGSGRPSSSSYWGQEHFKGKMYSFQIYDNGTLVRDLVPCIKDSDNTVGAYDIVNDVFYTVPTGYTTDKLVAGNPV